MKKRPPREDALGRCEHQSLAQRQRRDRPTGLTQKGRVRGEEGKHTRKKRHARIFGKSYFRQTQNTYNYPQSGSPDASETQMVSCQMQLAEGGTTSQRLGNRKRTTRVNKLRPRALMGRQCTTTTAQTGDGSDHEEKKHPTAPHPIDTKPTQKGEKKTNWESEEENDPSTHTLRLP